MICFVYKRVLNKELETVTSGRGRSTIRGTELGARNVLTERGLKVILTFFIFIQFQKSILIDDWRYCFESARAMPENRHEKTRGFYDVNLN